MIKNKKFINITLTFLFVVFSVIIILLLIFNLTGKLKYYVVMTDSMYPVISTNSLVYTKAYDFNQLKEGDIISFYADVNLDTKKEVIIHYFDSYEKINDEVFIRTKKIDSKNLDSWKITKNDFIGIYFFKVPKIGKLIRYLISPLGIVNIILGIIVFPLISAFNYNFKTQKLPLYEFRFKTNGI